MSSPESHPAELTWSRYLVDDGQGGQHMAGCHQRVYPIGLQFVGETGLLPVWGELETCPILPDADLATNESKRAYTFNEANQNGYPACCLAAWANAIQLFLAFNGRDHSILDWYRPWHKLSGGRGGVNIGDALEFIMTEGFPLKDGSGVVFIDEAWEAPSVKGFLSGLALGCVGVFGHDQHAEAGVSIVADASGLNVDTLNSWGAVQTWHLFPAQQIDIGNYGAYLIRECKIRPIDTTGWADAL